MKTRDKWYGCITVDAATAAAPLQPHQMRRGERIVNIIVALAAQYGEHNRLPSKYTRHHNAIRYAAAAVAVRLPDFVENEIALHIVIPMCAARSVRANNSHGMASFLFRSVVSIELKMKIV